jgi:hypothetical protein
VIGAPGGQKLIMSRIVRFSTPRGSGQSYSRAFVAAVVASSRPSGLNATPVTLWCGR